MPLASVFHSLLVVVGVHELGQNLSGVARRVEVVGVLAGLLLGTLLAAVARKDVFAMVIVVVLVFIKVCLRHVGGCCFLFYF